MRVAITWGYDARHVHLARWQVQVLKRWACQARHPAARPPTEEAAGARH
jgi:hypothetical protein